VVLSKDEQNININWEAYPGDDSSDPYDWVLDSIMAASPVDQPVPIDVVVEPLAQSGDD
jgi:hypothetical protein